MSAESFLDRYSLPRIARLIAPKVVHDDQQQQKQQGKSKKLSSVNHLLHPINSSSTTAAVNSDANNCDDIKADSSNNGELFLLYRHLKKYKVYHAVNAKSGTNRKKGIKIPQDFTGECRRYQQLVTQRDIMVDCGWFANNCAPETAKLVFVRPRYRNFSLRRPIWDLVA